MLKVTFICPDQPPNIRPFTTCFLVFEFLYCLLFRIFLLFTLEFSRSFLATLFGFLVAGNSFAIFCQNGREVSLKQQY